MTSPKKTQESAHPSAPLIADELPNLIGSVIFQSDWTRFSQEEVNAFGAITRDPDPMHVDPQWAKTHSPYGQTILAGFNILSLLPSLARNNDFEIKGISLIMNYGFDRIRFIAPLPVGALFRNTVVIKSVIPRPDGKIKLVTTNTIEVKGADRPAMTADWINILWP